MQIIRNRALAANHWRHELESTEELKSADIPAGDIVVSLERWVSDWEQLLARGTKIAVKLDPDSDINRLLATEFHEIWMIELVFGTFAEGRGYSQARLLRDRHDFLGDIRATGDVSRDRISFMERCGVNEFVLNPQTDLEQALEAFTEISVQYQPTVDKNPVVAELRNYRLAA